jgi:hypothetical protein
VGKHAYDADQWRVKRTESSTVSYAFRSPDGQLLTDWRPGSGTANVQDYVYVGTRLVAAMSQVFNLAAPTVVCPATPTELVNMDFEKGASLASLGFAFAYDASTQSGAGLGSTWGVRGSGSASQLYYAEAGLAVTFSGRAFRLEADFDHADAAENGYGYSAFELRGGDPEWPWWFLSLYHGVGDRSARDRLELYLPYDDDGFPAWASGTGVITPGTTQRITVCGQVSTVDDWEGVVNPDGSVFVYVGNTLQYASTGRRIGTEYGSAPTQVMIGAMGRFDNFVVKQQ